MKKNLHFSHANGFPAETYRKFLSCLEPNFTISYINAHGHDPNYPVTDNWPDLVNELINYLQTKYSEPVIGVGHSLGGVLTLMAAVKHPELFTQIILLDSPIFSTFRSRLLRFAKQLGFIDKVTPAHRTRVRRDHWASYDEAILYFKGKKLFRNFDPDCLKDYVYYGTEKTPSGVKLKFDREIEYQIFRTLPHHLAIYREQLTVPATLIYGKESDVIKAGDLAVMQKHFNMQSVRTEGGHLFPFEHPESAAKLIKEMISVMQKK